MRASCLNVFCNAYNTIQKNFTKDLMTPGFREINKAIKEDLNVKCVKFSKTDYPHNLNLKPHKSNSFYMLLLPSTKDRFNLAAEIQEYFYNINGVDLDFWWLYYQENTAEDLYLFEFEEFY